MNIGDKVFIFVSLVTILVLVWLKYIEKHLSIWFVLIPIISLGCLIFRHNYSKTNEHSKGR